MLKLWKQENQVPNLLLGFKQGRRMICRMVTASIKNLLEMNVARAQFPTQFLEQVKRLGETLKKPFCMLIHTLFNDAYMHL